jgi:hypothetical protein
VPFAFSTTAVHSVGQAAALFASEDELRNGVGRCTAAFEDAIGSWPVLDCEIWTQDGHAQIVVEFEGTPCDLLHNLLHKWLHTILKISIYTEH